MKTTPDRAKAISEIIVIYCSRTEFQSGTRIVDAELDVDETGAIY
jgi:hypothetical protein